MVATGFGLDDKLSLSGGTMSGAINFQGSPPYYLVNSGGSAAVGEVTLNGTTAVSVATTALDSDSYIFLTVQSGTPVGMPYPASKTPGTGFTVKSTSASDTAVVVAWCIVEGIAAGAPLP
jgi:hypothetical protein